MLYFPCYFCAQKSLDFTVNPFFHALCLFLKLPLLTIVHTAAVLYLSIKITVSGAALASVLLIDVHVQCTFLLLKVPLVLGEFLYLSRS